MKKTILVCLMSLAVTPAFAADKKDPSTECFLQENVTISPNINVIGKTYVESKKKFDDKVKQLGAIASEAGIRIIAQSWNYSINPQLVNYDNDAPEAGFMLNGGGNYQVENTENAMKLAELLTSHKIQTSVNVNAFKNPHCTASFNGGK